jgi:hypothetical protein
MNWKVKMELVDPERVFVGGRKYDLRDEIMRRPSSNLSSAP